jgi:hypothetical protein
VKKENVIVRINCSNYITDGEIRHDDGNEVYNRCLIIIVIIIIIIIIIITIII